MFEIGVVVAVIMAVGEFAKRYVNSKYIPAVTMALGVLAGYVYLPHAGVQDAIMNGVMVGLMSNGLFDTAKMVIKK